MFAIDQKITDIQLRGKNILKVYVSMNNHLVATPDTSLEEARSYVFIFREGKRKLSVYIGLHLLLTDRKLIYAHSDNPLPEDDLQEVEEEARNFAEDLGAMLDEVNFADMSDLEQEHWIEEQSIFSDNEEPEAASGEQASRPDADEDASSIKAPSVKEESAPVVGAVSAPQVPEQPVPRPSYAETQEKEQSKEKKYEQEQEPEPEQQHEATAPALEGTNEETRAAQLAVAKRRREITQKNAAANITRVQKQATGKGPPSATGVVSRDREALARLLTSF